MCLDARLINHYCVKCNVLMSSTHEIFSHFSNKKLGTAADASNGYWAVPISSEKTALFAFFDTRSRKKKFLRNAQGFKNAGSSMQTLMHRIFENSTTVRTFVDNIYIPTTEAAGWAGQLEALRDMLTRMQRANVKIKPAKFQICELL